VAPLAGAATPVLWCWAAPCSSLLGWAASKGCSSSPKDWREEEERGTGGDSGAWWALPWQVLPSGASAKPLWQVQWKLPGLLWQTWLQPPFC
jgi:hypothetical protein